MRFSAIGQALLDRKGAIVDANPALAAIFGTDTDELVGSMFGAHFIDAQDEVRRSRELAALAEGVFRTTRQWRSRAGELRHRSEEHTSELQSLMRISYAVFCLKKKQPIPN